MTLMNKGRIIFKNDKLRITLVKTPIPNEPKYFSYAVHISDLDLGQSVRLARPYLSMIIDEIDQEEMNDLLTT